MSVIIERRWFKSTTDDQVGEIMRARDFAENIAALQLRGLEPGVSTGWRSVDELYTVRPREWTLITGIPGHGKSTWLDNLMVNLYRKFDWHFAVFSAENWPLERHAVTLMSQLQRKQISEFADGEFVQRSTDLDEGWAFICPKQEDYTVEHVLELTSMAVSEDSKIRGVVIDPWNELDHSRPSSMNETEYISRCLTRIRRFARAHEVHVFLVAHPTKLQKQKSSETGEMVYPVPTPYDVSGSAHFRNKSDNCLCVWRDVEDPRNETFIFVQKIRFREVGKIGQCKLNYDWRSGGYIDPRPNIEDYMDRREPGEEG